MTAPLIELRGVDKIYGAGNTAVQAMRNVVRARWPRWPTSGSRTVPGTGRPSSPAASSSAWRSHGPW